MITPLSSKHVVRDLKVSNIPDKKRLFIQKCKWILKDLNFIVFGIPLIIISSVVYIPIVIIKAVICLTLDIYQEIYKLTTYYGSEELNDVIMSFNYAKNYALKHNRNEIEFSFNTPDYTDDILTDLMYLVKLDGNYKIITHDKKQIYLSKLIQYTLKIKF